MECKTMSTSSFPKSLEYALMYVIRFRWAACQLDALGKCRSPYELRKALQSLPKTLDDTYARILLNIDREDYQNALRILQWLAYSARPLQIEEITEVITVDIEGNPRWVSVCPPTHLGRPPRFARPPHFARPPFVAQLVEV